LNPSRYRIRGSVKAVMEIDSIYAQKQEKEAERRYAAINSNCIISNIEVKRGLLLLLEL
jgi:hypothetical protein